MNIRMFAITATICGLVSSAVGYAADWGLKEGDPGLRSAGALAFGPDGILFVGDTKAATIFALDTGDTKGERSKVKLKLSGLNTEVASLLGSPVDQVTINDLATNPLTGNAFLSVTKGKGDSASPAIVKISDGGKLEQLSLAKIRFQKVALPNAPKDETITRNGRSSNPRDDSITDLAYAEGKVFVSGLTAGTAPGFQSNLHQIPFPFSDSVSGTQVEIYHAAHGKKEDYAAIRTFVPLNINGEPTLLAGFVCTPLVRFPINNLKSGEKSRGTTVAELGNRNRPLDIIAYKKDGHDFLLMSNSARGVMKISTQDIARPEGLSEHVPDGKTAGQSYETIKELEGVVQLDRLNDDNVVVIIQVPGGSQNLDTVPLP